MLTALGISEPDERIYRCFLDQGPVLVPDLAVSLGASVDHVRRSVARLTELGLLRAAGRGRHQATNPQATLLPLLARRQFEAETALASARTDIDRIAERYRDGRLRADPRNLVEVLSDRELIRERVEELSNSATSHMWALDRPPYVDRPDGQHHSNEDEFAITATWLRQGIEVRSIYCPQSMERPGRFATLLRLAELGEQSRLLPSLPFKLHIIDKRVALAPLSGPVYDDLVVIHPSGMLDALMELRGLLGPRRADLRHGTHRGRHLRRGRDPAPRHAQGRAEGPSHRPPAGVQHPDRHPAHRRRPGQAGSRHPFPGGGQGGSPRADLSRHAWPSALFISP